MRAVLFCRLSFLWYFSFFSLRTQLSSFFGGCYDIMRGYNLFRGFVGMGFKCKLKSSLFETFLYCCMRESYLFLFRTHTWYELIFFVALSGFKCC